MIPPDLLRRVRQIEIRARHLVEDVFAGRYESAFRGSGLSFEEVREYQPGDEVRTIDWNVTARLGTPYVKKYRAEREQTVLFLLDTSASQGVGSGPRSKADLMAELCAVLAFCAHRNNDWIGAILFSDGVDHFLAPGKGPTHMLRLIRDVVAVQPAGAGTNLRDALVFLNRVARRRAVVFLLSDFLTHGYERLFRVTARRHDLIAVRMTEPLEQELPRAALVRLGDSETLRTRIVDTRSDLVRRQYARLAASRSESIEELCRKADADLIELDTARDFVPSLLRFFRARASRYSH